MVDVANAGPGADEEHRHSNAVAVAVVLRWVHVVVEAAPVIPGQEDRRGVPVWAAHHRVDQTGDVGHPLFDLAAGVLAHAPRRHDPADRGQRPVLGILVVVVDGLDVAELAVLLHVGEARQGIPNAGRLRVLVNGTATHGVGVIAVGLIPGDDVVLPRHRVLVEQVGDVSPREVVVPRQIRRE